MTVKSLSHKRRWEGLTTHRGRPSEAGTSLASGRKRISADDSQIKARTQDMHRKKKKRNNGTVQKVEIDLHNIHASLD